MDTELILWILIFVGGYTAVVGYLLRIALTSKDDGSAEPPAP
jgi:hypothetical protein